ncbi:MAG: glycosyltransferase family 39 protein [Thaumarchaeota archaeon]|nr:glycosyltransferase family 39 protein [Nitrososphaerota archaeon]
MQKIKPVYLLGIILALAGFTHLWNATGFPDIFFDEGVYLARAMNVLDGFGPQVGYFHDHPFFGQIFLAASLGLTGFPNSLHPSMTQDSIALLYLVPRIIMGLLAVLDTFLVYLIADIKYGKKTALAASLLFAVMPITWILRSILLDSILLPFLLASIFLAFKVSHSHKYFPALVSGIFLGLAIFTKIPVFTMIPLVAGLVYFHSGKDAKTLALFLLPVLLIPLLWPLQAVEAHQFDLWVKDVLSQTQRHSTGLPYISLLFSQMDPVLFVLGVSGMGYAIFRRDYLLLFWIVPFVLFLLLIGYNQYFYWIPVLPVFCISSAILLIDVLGKIRKKNADKILPIIVISGIAVFGLASTIMVISTNLTNTEFAAAAYVSQNVTSDTTVLASPVYSWMLNYVFHKENVPSDYSYVLFDKIKTSKVLLVADPHFLIDIPRGKQLAQVYNDSKTIATFNEDVSMYNTNGYPYSSVRLNLDGMHIEVRTK